MPGLPPDAQRLSASALAARLRTAGSVFAEEEAQLLLSRARSAEELEELAALRIAGAMLEHVVGEVEFCGQQLPLGPGCFVPRRRTRLLARLAVAALRGHPASPRDLRFVEVCCGIAPIAAVVHRALPTVSLDVADVDPVPLAHARRHLPPTAGVHRGDLLDALPASLRGAVDVIAAVTPYVPTTALPLLPREVREHESELAVHGGEDGLDLARRLVTEAPTWLAPGGMLLLELHREQAALLARKASDPALTARFHGALDGRTGVLALRRGC